MVQEDTTTVVVADGTTDNLQPVYAYLGRRITSGGQFVAAITLPLPVAKMFDLAGAELAAGLLFAPSGSELIDVEATGWYTVLLHLRSIGMVLQKTALQQLAAAIFAIFKMVVKVIISVAKALLEVVEAAAGALVFLAKYWWLIALGALVLLVLLVIYRPTAMASVAKAAAPPGA